jgi:hypothetical protein
VYRITVLLDAPYFLKAVLPSGLPIAAGYEEERKEQ